MRASSILFLAGAFLLSGFNFVEAGDPASAKPADPCATPLTWSSIKGIPESVYQEIDATVSDGEQCCRLCNEEQLDCTAAAFDEGKEEWNCRMAVNQKEYFGTTKTEKCPLGVSVKGDIDEVREDWSAYILGPCYNPPW